MENKKRNDCLCIERYSPFLNHFIPFNTLAKAIKAGKKTKSNFLITLNGEYLRYCYNIYTNRYAKYIVHDLKELLDNY